MSFGFGKALDVLRDGDAVRRMSWDWEPLSGQTSLVLVPGTPALTVDADRPLGKAMPELVGQELTYAQHIDLVHLDGVSIFVSPWHPTHEDLLAEDWDYV